mmetsp:Transcript_97480/g.203446  ORF Transcript_97480/g.203446 Transcript_97480/m.203446 type:complete len:442 (+) Transcript_97480:65-1390(+)
MPRSFGDVAYTPHHSRRSEVVVSGGPPPPSSHSRNGDSFFGNAFSSASGAVLGFFASFLGSRGLGGSGEVACCAMSSSSNTGAAAAGGGCDTGCESNLESGGSIIYVGSEQGDWVTETTYRFVGEGQGDLMFVSPVQRNWIPCLLAFLGLLLLSTVLVIWSPQSTTTTFAPGHLGTCLFWGDPHLQTFDGARPSFYGDGEYWIVKNPSVKIQGRYMGTKWTLGLAATSKVAVSGPFIDNHLIEVEPMEKDFGGAILLDGVEVLNKFGTLKFSGARITYDDQGELVDEATSKWKKNIVHMDLPKGISMTVFRWDNYLDLKITMPPMETDGSCGNFNGDASDDTVEAIFDRVGARVDKEDLLFSRGASISMSSQAEDMLRKYCVGDKLQNATNECLKEIPATARTTEEVSACTFDHCFGMNAHALQIAKQFATEKERENLGIE